MIKENKLTLCRCEEVPEAQHLYRHSEDEVRRILSKIRRFFALCHDTNLNSKSNLLRMTYSRHSEDVCPKNLVHNNKILRFAQDDEVAEAGQNFVILRERSDRRILSKIKRFFALRHDTNLNSKSNLLRMTRKRAAFTLAEVLITLGIIGIVAAVTIPTLVKNYEKRVTVTKLKKVYSTLNQIMLKSFADNGPATQYLSAGAVVDAETTNNFFNTYWLPYFRSPHVADYGTTFYKRSGAYHLLNGVSNDVFIGTSDGRILFKDASGNIFLIRVDYWDQTYDSLGNSISAIARYNTTQLIWVDLNGEREPNTFGKDLFAFVADFSANNVVPSGYGLSDTKINNNCKKDGRGHYCAAKIMKDGWKIKDDYPW